MLGHELFICILRNDSSMSVYVLLVQLYVLVSYTN